VDYRKNGGRSKASLPSLAIVGSHPATRELAPYDDPAFEIWLFNESPQKPEIYKRWDASFQIHLPAVYANDNNWVNKDHWRWLQEYHGPSKRIWMQDVDERVPNSVRYPLDEVLEQTPYHYLRSTPAMALALAIYLGYTDIWLYGSELSSGTEYTYQAINYAFWIGFAHGKGVNLHLECWQKEFDGQPIYGYEGELQLSKEFFKARVAALAEDQRQNDYAYKKLQDRLRKAIFDNETERAGELSLNLESQAMKAGESLGALAEAQRYADLDRPHSRQEFERVSAKAKLEGRELEIAMHHSAGTCEYVWNGWRQTGQAGFRDQFMTFLKVRTKHAYDTGVQIGIYNENVTYLTEYDARMTAAGGQRALYQAAVGVQDA
jgi:hypothetical protein